MNPLRTLILFVLLASVLAACGPGNVRTLRWSEGTAQGYPPIVAADDGTLYWRRSSMAPRGALAVAAVTHDETQHVVGVFRIERNNPPWIELVEVSSAGTPQMSGREDNLAHSSLATFRNPAQGIAILNRSTSEEGLVALSGSVRAGWYWVLHPGQHRVAPSGLQRFAKRLELLDATGEVVVGFGEVAEDEADMLLVEANTLPSSATRIPVIVAIDDEVPNRDAIVETLNGWAVASSVPIELQTSPAQAADISVSTRTPGGVEVVEFTVDPTHFQVSMFASHRVLGVPGIVEYPLQLPREAAANDVAEVILGLASVRAPLEPLGPWLLERQADRGLRLAGSAASLQWRLTELYALAGHLLLALETVADLSEADAATEADGKRYAARAYHLSLARGPDEQATRSAFRLYTEAIEQYRLIRFPLGEAVASLNMADLTDAQTLEFDVARIRGQREAAVLAFDDAGAYALAADTLLHIGRATVLGGDPDQNILMRAYEGFEAGEDARGMSRAAAWLALTSASAEDASRWLAIAQTGRAGAGVLLAEGRLEALQGRNTQAVTSYLAAGELAMTAAQPDLVSLALGGALEQMQAASSTQRAGALARLSGDAAQLGRWEEDLRGVQGAACGMVVTTDAGDLDGALACLGLVQWLSARERDAEALPVLAGVDSHRVALGATFEGDRLYSEMVRALKGWAPADAETEAARRRWVSDLARGRASLQRREDRNLDAARTLSTALEALDQDSAERVGLRIALVRAQLAGGQLDQAEATLEVLSKTALDADAYAQMAHDQAVLKSRRGDLSGALAIVDGALSDLTSAGARHRMELLLLGAQLRTRIAAQLTPLQ